jgi:LPXTG-site transpeptidase (sortase) family protein
MVKPQERASEDSPQAPWGRNLLFLLGILAFIGMLTFPFLSGEAAAFLSGTPNAAAAGGDVYLPIVYQSNPTQTPTPTDTGTATATSTSTSTSTATATGTQPTSTATGTITPNPTLTVKVTPTSTEVGGKFTFTIEMGNGGYGPAQGSVIADSFPSYIDIESVNSEHGTVSKSSHSFTVSFGSFDPGEKNTITVIVKANSNASQTETISNIVTWTYNENKSKTASVSYKVVVSSLPGTGELPLNWQDKSPPNRSGLIQGILAGILGAILLIYGIWAGGRDPRTARWMSIVGALMILLAVGVILVTSGILGSLGEGEPATVTVSTATLEQSVAMAEQAGQESQQSHLPASAFSTPEALPLVTLPSYPIPTPVVSITPQPGEETPDTTAIERIVIPALMLDTVVAYVPFDGYSWLISGLNQEVAWMGNTSWPGLGGNTGLAGHVTVTGFGDGPFRHLDELTVGEIVILYTEKNMYTYQVREQAIVEDGDMWVVNATENPQITLITCTNWNNDVRAYLNRLIIYADLIRTEPIPHSGLSR